MTDKPAPAAPVVSPEPVETVRHEKRASVELDALRARTADTVAATTKRLESLVPQIVGISDAQAGAIREVCAQLRALVK